MPGRPTYTLFPYTTLFRSAFSTATSGNGAVTYYDSTGLTIGARSEERRVGKECRSRSSPEAYTTRMTTSGGATTNDAGKRAAGRTNADTLRERTAIQCAP